MRSAAILATIMLAPLLASAAAPVANTVAPAAAVTPTPDIRSLVDAMFTDPDVGETRAVIVVHRGRIVAERYAPGYDASMRYISWSMAKSVTGVLIGFLVMDGRLELDAPAPVAEWQNEADPRRAITLRQLIHMSSGLDHTEIGDPVWTSQTVQMLFLDHSDDMAGYATVRPLEARPGARFEYSSATSVILADIVADTLTESRDPGVRAAAYRRFAEQRLAGPAGLSSLFFEFDARGTQIGGSLIHATARDWARFGEMLRTGRGMGGRQVIDPAWRGFMLTPSALNPEYGGQIWLNRPGGDRGEPVLFPAQGPATAFSAIGHLGQYVSVSPSQELVVVRLGNTPETGRAAVVEGIAAIFRAFPETVR